MRILMLAALFVALNAHMPLQAADFSGRCTAISDGDTIKVLTDKKVLIKVRLEGIDCPELRQDFGRKAKEYTGTLLFGKRVVVHTAKKDRYGRSVARVTINGKDASLEIVRAGMAWHYTLYSKDLRLAQAEAQARARKIGLWSQPHPIPPWDFRHRKQACPHPVPAMKASRGGAAPQEHVSDPRCRSQK